jgi:hypothetical protein
MEFEWLTCSLRDIPHQDTFHVFFTPMQTAQMQPASKVHVGSSLTNPVIWKKKRYRAKRAGVEEETFVSAEAYLP